MTSEEQAGTFVLAFYRCNDLSSPLPLCFFSFLVEELTWQHFSSSLAAVDRFKAFLRVKSTSHSGPVTGTYAEAVALLKQYAEEIGLVTTVVECVPKKPILVFC